MKIDWTECNIIPGEFALQYEGEFPAYFLIKLRDNERNRINLSIYKINRCSNGAVGIIDGSFAYDFDKFSTIIGYCKVEE